MSRLTLNGVCVDFPIHSSQSIGLVNTLFGFRGNKHQRIEAKGMGRVHVHALRDIDLDLRPGQRVGLIGRNGAGKSTLLRVLSGVYEPTAGTIQSEGNISALTDLMLGMDPEASGYEFITTRGIVMGLNKQEANALVPDVEAFTELGDYLHLPVRAYSSGMMLRLAFAVATAVTPDILLMDEMIGVGDAQFLDKAHARLTKLMDKVEILVLASHNEQILRRFCTHGVLLAEGQIAHMGPIDTCLRK